MGIVKDILEKAGIDYVVVKGDTAVIPHQPSAVEISPQGIRFLSKGASYLRAKKHDGSLDIEQMAKYLHCFLYGKEK